MNNIPEELNQDLLNQLNLLNELEDPENISDISSASTDLNKIIIKENGKKFDQLLKSKEMITKPSMQGMKYIKYFLEQYKQDMTANYIYDNKNFINQVTLDFNIPIVRIKPDKCMITFSDFNFMGRIEAMAAASSQVFDDECLVYTLHISRQDFMISSLYSFLHGIILRLPKDKKLRVILPNKHHKEMVENWFDSEIIEIITS